MMMDNNVVGATYSYYGWGWRAITRGGVKEEEKEDDVNIDALHLRQYHSTTALVFVSSSSSFPFASPLVIILSPYLQ